MLENYTRNAYEEIRENTGETLEETQNTDQISNDKKKETEEDLHGDDQHGDDQVITRRGVGCHFHLISS